MLGLKIFKLQMKLLKITRKHNEPFAIHPFLQKYTNLYRSGLFGFQTYLDNTKSTFIVPQSNTNSHKYSFYPRTIRDWNNLPLSLIEANEFVNLLSITV